MLLLPQPPCHKTDEMLMKTTSSLQQMSHCINHHHVERARESLRSSSHFGTLGCQCFDLLVTLSKSRFEVPGETVTEADKDSDWHCQEVLLQNVHQDHDTALSLWDWLPERWKPVSTASWSCHNVWMWMIVCLFIWLSEEQLPSPWYIWPLTSSMTHSPGYYDQGNNQQV